MGLGHVPQEPVRPEGARPVVQGRQRRRAPAPGPQPVEVDRSRLARGRFGEDEAARWYTKHGWSVIDRNWRCSTGELDLVVERDGVIVFCEVKARANDRYGPAAAAVDARKQQKLRGLALAWLSAHPEHRRESIRFDVAAVTGARITVIESAF